MISLKKKMLMRGGVSFIRPTRWEQSSIVTGTGVQAAETGFMCDGRAQTTAATAVQASPTITAYFDRTISFLEVFIGSAPASAGFAINDSQGTFQIRQNGVWSNQWGFGSSLNQPGVIRSFKWSAVEPRVCDAIRVINDGSNRRMAISELRVK